MFQSSKILCAGIIVADHVCTPIHHLPAAGELVLADSMLLTIGGYAANVAVGLARMGMPPAVAGRVGEDVFGKIVADLLQDNGVDVGLLRATPGVATSQTLIVNVAGQDRRFIHTVGANGEFTAADLPLDRVLSAEVFYLGGYRIMPNMRQAELVPVFAEARRRGVKTVLDVVIPGEGNHLGELEQLLAHVDVFMPNHYEAELITGERDAQRQAELFRKLGVGTAIITMGNEGTLLVEEGRRLQAGVFDVPFVDGSGGGDAFAAGYICGLMRGLDAEGSLRTASALGASCVRAIGTTTGVFTESECEEFLREHQFVIRKL